ncbi:M24 family metallopeptidase [Bacteroidota bacterium]
MSKKIIPLVLILSIFFSAQIKSQTSDQQILPLRERVEIINNLLEEKFEIVLPELMRREGIDMWVIASEELNGDPVIKTMLPATSLYISRRTIIVMHDEGPEKGVKKYSVNKKDFGKHFKKTWYDNKVPNTEAEDYQWKRLGELVAELNPKKIGINTSNIWAAADGLSHTEYELFVQNLPEKYHKSIVSAERLGVAWLETRSPSEITIYEQICRIAHNIIREGLSDKVIHPGITTTDDVVWFYREKIAEYKMKAWFQPSCSIQRIFPEEGQKVDKKVIMPGDVVHMDMGIVYLRLCTDMQENAYILRPGERDAPDYVKKALANSNRLQDILISKIEIGKTGNQILKETLAQMKDEGIEGSIYCHPIGYHGHAAGSTFGMWDMQEGVPGKGDYEVNLNTAYSIELNASTTIPELNNIKLRFALEEDGIITKKGFRYIDGRQKELLLVPRVAKHLKQ